MKSFLLSITIILLIIFLIYLVFFTVDETEYAILLYFGKPIKVIKEPGLYMKLPYPINSVLKFDNRLLVLDPPVNEFLTKDKKNILVSSYLCWKIDDPLLFYQTLTNRDGAESRLTDLLTSEVGASLGKVDFSSLVNTDKDKVKISEMMNEITKNIASVAKAQYGIKIVDVKLKRLNFPEQNKASVFNRMKAERQRIARKYRSEGEAEAEKIKAQTEKMVRELLAKANQEAEKIKGEGEAEAIRIYAESYGKDPSFYKFLKTLNTYEKIINDKTFLVIPANSELLKLLTSPELLKSAEKYSRENLKQ